MEFTSPAESMLKPPADVIDLFRELFEQSRKNLDALTPKRNLYPSGGEENRSFEEKGKASPIV